MICLRIPETWATVMENFKNEVMIHVPLRLKTLNMKTQKQSCRVTNPETSLAQACGDEHLRASLQEARDSDLMLGPATPNSVETSEAPAHPSEGSVSDF